MIGEKSSGLDPIARKNPEASTPDFSYNPDFLSADEQTALIEHLNQLPWQKVLDYTAQYFILPR